jgi:tungstate transport system ATP-binding protein
MSDLPVTLSNVSYRVGETSILRDVNLVVHAGAPTFVIGPNGSGKSTLLRLIMGLIEPTAGAIDWAGSRNPAPRRRAMVFQHPMMLRRSVAGNLLYALEQAGVEKALRDRRCSELLQKVGLSDLADRPARRLSGGERQKLAFTRALARSPELLILDEPTASLDPSATFVLERLIAQAASEGIKILMASHDLGQVRRLAGDVVFLHRGRILESAPVQNFLAQPRTAQASAFLRGDLIMED